MSQKEIYSKDELELKEVVSVLWKNKRPIIQTTIFLAISSVVISFMLTNYYQSSSLLVAKTQSENRGSLSSISGLASFAGLTLPSSGQDKAIQAIEIIKSRNFVKHLITFEDVLPSLMAAKHYESSSGKLFYNDDIYDPDTKKWKQEPTYLKTHLHYINNVLQITRNDETGFIFISVEHISPIFAKEFLDLIIKEANNILRERDLYEATQALEFLKKQLSKTSLVEVKESINSLIKVQLETQMLSKVNEDYVLTVIDSPFVAEDRVRPKRTVIVILTTMLGALVSMFYFLLRYYYVDELNKASE